MNPGWQLVAVSALLVSLGAAPAPEASLAPTTTLPEIGRTRSTRLPCAVIRDLVAPAVGGAMDASAAFEAAKGDLRQFANVPGARRPNEAAQTMVLMALDRKKSAIAKGVLTISKSLGDARVAESQSDATTHELRQALQALYDAENAKLNAVSAFLEAQRWSQLFNEDETMSQMARTNSAALSAAAARPEPPRVLPTPQSFNLPTQAPGSIQQLQRQHPVPGATVAPLSPERQVTSEAGSIAAKEAAASRTIVNVAATCR